MGGSARKPAEKEAKGPKGLLAVTPNRTMPRPGRQTRARKEGVCVVLGVDAWAGFEQERECMGNSECLP